MGAATVAAAAAGNFGANAVHAEHQSNKAAAVSQQASQLSKQASALSQQTIQITGDISTLANRVASDEAKICTVQQEGIPTGHALAHVVYDFHRLLTALLSQTATSKHTRKMGRHQRRSAREDVRLTDRLNADLGLYVAAEKKIPAGISCTSSTP